MDKISLCSLVIETTRRCNLECDHCMRGEQQDLDMTREYLEQMFPKLGHISCLTFSGGEPTLAPEVMDWCLELAQQYRVDVGNFYVVTNAKVVPDKFLLAIVQWHNFCTENEISGVAVSADRYHDGCADEMGRLEAFSFLEVRMHPMDDMEGIIADGRAKNWGGTSRPPDRYEVDPGGYVSEGDIYLNCKGNIVAGCDFSYTSQDKHTICSAKEFATVLLPQL